MDSSILRDYWQIIVAVIGWLLFTWQFIVNMRRQMHKDVTEAYEKTLAQLEKIMKKETDPDTKKEVDKQLTATRYELIAHIDVMIHPNRKSSQRGKYGTTPRYRE